MKVLTLDPKSFADTCHRLAERIGCDGYHPDVILGIKNGGSHVADEVAKHFNTAKRADISARRASTALKENNLSRRLLHCLPVVVLDVMRMAESYFTRGRKPVQRQSDISLPEDLADYMAYTPRQVLIVDDAIDSGATMATILTDLSARYPLCRFRTAAITVTTPHPMIDADFHLYHNCTLIRFPWAADA